jgi:methyl-accepting chemotaxis protein
MNAMKWGSLLSGGSTMISDQLAHLVRVVLIFFGLLLFAYLLTALVTTQRVKTQSDIGSFAQTILSFDNELLQMRRNEKDFFERRNKEELEKHKVSYNGSIERLKDARSNPTATADDIKQIDILTSEINAYRKLFLSAVETQIALGLDENSGLQGNMRKAVRASEELGLKLGDKDLELGILFLRRHEKDFILRERDEYVTQFNNKMGDLKQTIAISKLDTTSRRQIEQLLAEYDKSFHDFVAGTLSVNKVQADMRGVARTAEQPVPQLLADSNQRRAEATAAAFLMQIISVVGMVVALGFVAWLMRRRLGVVRTSITSSVGQLQHTIDRVRQGEDMTGIKAITSEDEMGQVWKSVDGLLSDRMEAQHKVEEEKRMAEAENERLNNSVISILQAVNQLSQRDLTVRAPVTKDIIGTVSDSINALTDETSKVLSGVNLIAAQVAEASGNVKTQADLVSKTVEDDRKSVGQMLSSLTDSAQTTNQMAALAEQSNRSAEQATQATDTALETVNGTIKGMDMIRETIAETEKRIKRLGERSQEITGIVNLINTISERTHVLALNASMQAAVAGEAGRGFAVVAEEVQRLAESSRNATEQIGTLVSNIQLETNETIATVNRTIGQVVQGSELAQKSGEQMRITQSITAQLVAQVRRIGESSEQQKAMSAGLMQSVQHIGQSSERTAQQIDVQNRETSTLLDFARRLVASVGVFKLRQAV